jgi:hypothetical protein
MKRLLLSALLVALPSLSFGQTSRFVTTPVQPTFDGGEITNPLILPDGTIAAPSAQCSSNLDTGLVCASDGSFNITLDNQSDGALSWYPDWFGFGPTMLITNHFTLIGNGAATGTWFTNEDNGIVGQGLSAQANAYRLYNLKSELDTGSPTNFERVEMGWANTTNTFEFTSEAGGSGTVRNFAFSGATVTFSDPIEFPTSSTAMIRPDYDTTWDGIYFTDSGKGYTYVQSGDSTDNFARLTLYGGDTGVSPSFTLNSYYQDSDLSTISCNNTATTGDCRVSFQNSSGGSTMWWMQNRIEITNDPIVYTDETVGIQWAANTLTLDSDRDNDADGTIILTVDNDDNQMVMNNTGISFEVEGQTPLALPVQSGEIDAHQEGTSTLTESSATDILSFPVTDQTTYAGTINLVTYCEDASDFVIQHETYDFVCLNDTDTEDCAFSTYLATPPEVGTGTATISAATLAFSGGTNSVTFTVNAVCSLTQTTLESRWEIEFHQPNWAVVTEQN